MGYRDNLYDFVLVLHLIAVIVGFGTVFLNGIYGSRAQQAGGPQGYAISAAVHQVGKVAEYFIYTVPVFGIILILLSDDVIKFSELWVSLSFLLYIVGIGLSHGVLIPTEKKMLRLQEELLAGGGAPGAGGPPPQVAELEASGKKMAAVSTVLNLLVVVVIFLMVFKPGSELL
jgi:uncharacterized membrane protein